MQGLFQPPLALWITLLAKSGSWSPLSNFYHSPYTCVSWIVQERFILNGVFDDLYQKIGCALLNT